MTPRTLLMFKALVWSVSIAMFELTKFFGSKKRNGRIKYNID